MFDNYGRPVLRTSALGIVRDAAGFDTGYRVSQQSHLSQGPNRLYQAGGFDTGYTLRQDRLYDRYGQSANLSVQPYKPWLR